MAAADDAAHAGRRARTALVASTIAFSLALLGTTVVNVALPAIGRDLGGGIADLQWVANGYSLMLASVLLSMGALCDQRGARRVVLAGVALFLAGATLGVLAPSLVLLVAAQLLLGAGAAALIPASLTLIRHAYPEPVSRARAIGVYSSASAAAVAAGPVVGGVLIETIGWRGVFAFDVPVALVIAALVVLGLDETPHVRTRHLDLAGQALAVLALSALTFGLIETGAAGWGSARTLVALAVAVLAGAAFAVVERRGAAPMLPLALLRRPSFTVASAAGLLFNFAVYGELFVLSLYLQQVRGLSALQTGALFAAMPTTAGLAALPSGRMTSRRGARVPAAVGGVLAAAGAVVLLALGETTPYPLLVAGLALFGAGGGLAVPALTTSVVTETDSRRMGMAAATFTTSRQIGGMLGVAVLGAMVAGGSFIDGLHRSLVVCVVAFVVCAAAAAVVIREPELAAGEPRQPGRSVPASSGASATRS